MEGSRQHFDKKNLSNFNFSPGTARSGRSQTCPGNLEARGVFSERQRGRLSVRHNAQPADQDPP